MRALLGEGFAVRVFDNFSSGFRENLSEVERDVEIVEADLRNLDAVRAACGGCAFVFHQAALGSVPRSIADPVPTHDVNAGGSLHVLLAARDAGVSRVVHASSSSIYGGLGGPRRVELDRVAPMSPYALSKYAGESFGTMFTALYGLEFIALRYFNVFGARQSPVSQYAAVIPRFIAAMLAGERPTICGDGLQTRDFTYIDNVVAANLLALRAPASSAIREAGGVFNIACGHGVSVAELVEKLNRLLGTAIDAVFADARPGEVRHSEAVVDLAARYLGYRPSIDFDEGLRRTVEYFVGQRDA